MNMLLLVTLILSLLFNMKDKMTQSFFWLQGVWEMKMANGSSRLEIWAVKDEYTLTGLGLKVMGSDTTKLESIELVLRDDQFWYTPAVPDQNQALSVPFMLVLTENTRFTFENPKHDFPQRIIYHLKPVLTYPDIVSMPGDTLYVRVETLEGKGIDFLFLRK